MPVEKSAGAIIFRKTPKGREYLLIQHRPPYNHWDLAKGHIEKGETTEETVRREVKEETGLSKIEIIPGFKETVKYFVGKKGERHLKFVAFFLAEAVTKRVKISWEHQDHKWAPYEEAFKLATYPDTKKLIQKADEFIQEKSF